MNMETVSGAINTYSNPSDLKITDVRFLDVGAIPMHCILMKVYTNQGIVGFGEVRDIGSKKYALQLKSILLGENPCNVDKIFRRIKQFGGPARQGGGVCAVEVALWDILGKVTGQPVYRLLGGKFRDNVRMYCDTDIETEGRNTGYAMGQALKARMEKGFTFLKMDLGIDILREYEGTLSAPLGFVEEGQRLHDKLAEARKSGDVNQIRFWKNRLYDYDNIPHPLTGINVTEKGFDVLENYVREVRETVGYEVPIAIDHFGHIGLKNCIKLCRRIEKYNIAWAEDLIPWQYTDQYKILRASTTVPIATGEDIYLKEGFLPLLREGGVDIIHPDILTAGGILETKKISDLAADYGVSMAMHMAESPIACMAAVHTAAACENFLVLEYHSVDVPVWNDIYTGQLPHPLVQDGFIKVPDLPGLGIEGLDDEVLAKLVHPEVPGMWEPTDLFNDDPCHDRIWS